jgi:membrane-associated protease RseP (regulator of RpoE activity)
LVRGQFYGFTLSGDPEAAPRVLAVQKNFPAAQAGLQPGNRLTGLNGSQIQTCGQAFEILAKTLNAGQPLKIDFENRPPAILPAIKIPGRSLPVYPTQIYSAINALLLCLLLLACDPLRRRDGELFALMISVYAAARFLLEILRTDEPPIFGTGMSIAQNISLLILILMAGFWLHLRRRPPGLAFPQVPSSTRKNPSLRSG